MIATFGVGQVLLAFLVYDFPGEGESAGAFG